MDYEIVSKQDQARLESLEKCRLQIEEGKKRGRDAIKQIAQALIMIEQKELYRDAGCESLNEYCERYVGLNRDATYKIMCSGKVVMTLEAGGVEISQIPALETHLFLLSKIPAEQLPGAWRDGLTAMDRDNIPVTTTSIKRLVDYITSPQSQAPRGSEGSARSATARGVNPQLSIQEDRQIYSEEAELALERIGRIAGADVREAIENHTLDISERDMIRWAQEDDATLKNLSHYIVELRWSLRKAIAYEAEMITGMTTIASLARLATARGGEYQGETVVDNSTWEFMIRGK
jgi:hypothetical protein